LIPFFFSHRSCEGDAGTSFPLTPRGNQSCRGASPRCLTPRLFLHCVMRKRESRVGVLFFRLLRPSRNDKRRQECLFFFLFSAFAASPEEMGWLRSLFSAASEPFFLCPFLSLLFNELGMRELSFCVPSPQRVDARRVQAPIFRKFPRKILLYPFFSEKDVASVPHSLFFPRRRPRRRKRCGHVNACTFLRTFSHALLFFLSFFPPKDSELKIEK